MLEINCSDGKCLQWPQYDTGEPVWFGDEIIVQSGLHSFSKRVYSIEIVPVTDDNGMMQGYDALIRFDDADWNPNDYMLVSMWRDETVHNIHYRTGE